MTRLRVGAGSSTIDFPDGTWPLDGFTRVQDALAVRVLVLDGATRVVLAVLDQTSLPPEPLGAVRDRIAAITGAPGDSVVVSVSHTFSAPHLTALDDTTPDARERMRLAREAVFAAVDAAAKAALASLRPATLGAADGVCDVNVNRDVETPDGWGIGFGESQFSDKQVSVVRIDDEERRPIALLLNYAVQPSAMNEARDAGGGRAVSADLAGAAVARLEAAFPGSVAMFVIGAAGDQAPALSVRGDAGTDGHLVSALLGERLGIAAAGIADSVAVFDDEPRLEVIRGALTMSAQQPTPRELIHPTRQHEFLPAGERELPYWILRLGGIVVIGVRVELSASTGRRIRQLSPFAHTLVATMVNGGAKYLPDVVGFERFSYEALSSSYAKGAAEQLTDAVVERLRSIR